MKRIVINGQHGGFGLSDIAVARYTFLKNLKLYPEKGEYSTDWYTVPKNERVEDIDWNSATHEERIEYNTRADKEYFTDRDIPRDDPVLVRVVEELGPAACGNYANLRIVYIPDDVKWCIEEYEGLEWVAEEHRTWS